MNKDAKMTHCGMERATLLHPPNLSYIVLSLRDISLATQLKEKELNWLVTAQDN